MQPEVAVPVAFAVACALTTLVTPLAIRIAYATAFLDRPQGYKGHGRPTPYLGGTAIVAGIVAAALLVGDGVGSHAVVLGGAGVLWMLGTADDRLNLSPLLRVAVEVAVATVIATTGHGWAVLDSDVLNDLLTVVWILGVVNAFNLMDNMNGAAATTLGVAVAGAGTLALVSGSPSLGALCFGIAGACVAFLRFNLARPARIFMGDGGSMPLGLFAAYATMQAALTADARLSAVLTASLLVAPAVLDTSLVVVSRRRGGRPVLSGGRDHLTHRLASRLGSSERVAAALALGHGAIVAVTVVAAHRGGGWTALVASVLLALGLVAIWALEQARWFPIGTSAVEAASPAVASVQT
jgi:UDP-GlcNAc:undecaprenyl-phosphate GlcNAc-1-phosphate transferase